MTLRLWRSRPGEQQLGAEEDRVGEADQPVRRRRSTAHDAEPPVGVDLAEDDLANRVAPESCSTFTSTPSGGQGEVEFVEGCSARGRGGRCGCSRPRCRVRRRHIPAMVAAVMLRLPRSVAHLLPRAMLVPPVLAAVSAGRATPARPRRHPRVARRRRGPGRWLHDGAQPRPRRTSRGARSRTPPVVVPAAPRTHGRARTPAGRSRFRLVSARASR